jgi:hypothetical protein
MQFDEVKMWMSYVSYRHALAMFEVELPKWEMEVALMHVEILHTIVVQQEEKWSMDQGSILVLESNMATFASNQHILKKMPELLLCHDYK